ncbi:MAG: hypothetical protein KI791_17630 [Cyclobacteriaceae bacterium]|nr:hypothetical protein [Cyclobacteriaceae bacterium SS2]
MKEDLHDDGIDTSFKSVRRNFNVLAIIILVLKVGDAKLKSISPLGIELEFNEGSLMVLLWISLFYLGIRYFQFLNLEIFTLEYMKWDWSYLAARLDGKRIRNETNISKYAEVLRLSPDNILEFEVNKATPEKKTLTIKVDYNMVTKEDHKQRSSYVMIPPIKLFKWWEVILRQLRFSIITRWAFTLYLPIILMITLVIVDPIINILGTCHH